jgi:hypothetical protein
VGPPGYILYKLYSIHHRVGRVLSFFSSRRNRDSPNPSHAGECSPSPLVRWGGAHSLATGERGGGRVPIPTRGHTLWYTINIYVLCGVHCTVGFGDFQQNSQNQVVSCEGKPGQAHIHYGHRMKI